MRRHVQMAVGRSATAAASDRPLVYDPVFDEYCLLLAGALDGGAVLRWCPWCARRLPATRREEWFARLRDAGLTPDDPLPERFQTDSWWTGGG
jgi:hypothetical protein